MGRLTKKHLTKKDEQRIIKIIEQWSEPKLTWPNLVDACKTKLGISRARQSLMKLPAIDMAIKDRKVALKAQTKKVVLEHNFLNRMGFVSAHLKTKWKEHKDDE